MGYDLRQIVLAAPVILFSLTVHEYFHAWVADKMGDPTARLLGRLTFNPIKHLDLFGVLVMIMSQFRFGWAKPVPINPMNLKNPRRDDFWISIAGPFSNLGLALIAGTIIRLVGVSGLMDINKGLYLIIENLLVINVILAFFNLIPLFPLDGSHILRSIAPSRYDYYLDQLERIGPILLLGLIASGFLFGKSLIWIILGPFVSTVVYLFSGLG